jgi:hypothetical protein
MWSYAQKSKVFQRRRRTRFERLERREMLSGTPPTVTKVEVGSTSWSSAFVQYLHTSNLGTNGYAIPVGSSAQSATITWDNVDEIFIKFSKDVNVDAADLSLSGVNQTTYGFSQFHYDPQTQTARWTLTTPINKDRLRLDLDATGANAVRDLGGNILDGEWTNNASTLSGNGTAGGDFEFNFNVLPTDVNNSGNVTSLDYTSIRQLDGKSTTTTGYIAKRDINGDGVINSTDWQEALDRALQALPTGSPAGANDDAPTTSGFALLSISDSNVDHAISLFSGFGDAESGAGGLTYSIVSNDNSLLFNSASIDSATGQLVVNAASDVSGRANITVRATDATGLSVESVATVDVNHTNQPPHISNLVFTYVGASTWMVSGDVTDPDDNVANFIVEFTGVFHTRSAVDDQGHFSFAVILAGNQVGMEYAVTQDPHGLQSNVAFGEIDLT